MNVRKSEFAHLRGAVVLSGLVQYQVSDGVLVMSADDARRLAAAILAQVDAR